MNTTTFSIQGMSCGRCVQHVSEAIRSVPGVQGAEVGVGSASVRLGDSATPDDVLNAIQDAGYTAQEQHEGGRP